MGFALLGSTFTKAIIYTGIRSFGAYKHIRGMWSPKFTGGDVSDGDGDGNGDGCTGEVIACRNAR